MSYRGKTLLKSSRNEKGLNDVTAAPVLASFSQLNTSCKKKHQKRGSPSYFVTTLKQTMWRKTIKLSPFVAHFLFKRWKMHTGFWREDSNFLKFNQIITCSTAFKAWMFLLIKHNDYVSGFKPRLLVAFPAKSDFLTISHACYPKEIIILSKVTKVIISAKGKISSISDWESYFEEGFFFYFSFAKKLFTANACTGDPRIVRFFGTKRNRANWKQI